LKKKTKVKKFKRLFFDIETSYNVVSTWRVGYKINISHDNIMKERAIICIAYKWAGDKKVYSLQWNKGDDKQMLIKFIKIMNEADEICGQNSDRFDIKWVRTRCIYHGIPMFPDYHSIDTLKLAKAGFNFNSNRLDYLGKFLGIGGKMDTGGFKLWQDIIMDNCSKSMNIMVKYCKKDVELLEKVYDKLYPYTKHKTHVGVLEGGSRCTCPECSSKETVGRGTTILASGNKKQRLQCLSCGKYFSMPLSIYVKIKKGDKSVK